ncbi:MAG: MerR family transcriptional regulator [Anaerolineae bacterium]|nr:MerR family transcriptional regulator [Anaerolineae bacterium]
MEELTIGEVARQVGINISAIRYYERIGLLPKSKRVNGQRRFNDDIIQTLHLILFAQNAGFNLKEIETLLNGFEPNTPPSQRWQLLANQKLGEIKVLIERAHMMQNLLEEVLHCGCARLEDCVTLTDTNKEQICHPKVCK